MTCIQYTMGQQVDLLKKPEISPKHPFIGLLHPHELPVHENVLQTFSNQPQDAQSMVKVGRFEGPSTILRKIKNARKYRIYHQAIEHINAFAP